MKHIVILGLFFLKITFLYSQNGYQKRVDSLYVLINEEENEAKRINHYQELCHIYDEYDFKQFIKCNEALLNHAKKNKSVQGYGYYYLNKSKISTLYDDNKQAIIDAQKSSQLFYSIKDWDNYLRVGSLLGIYLSYKGEYEKSTLLLNKLLKMPYTKNRQYEANIYYSLAYLYYDTGEYDKAMLYSKQLLLNKNITVKKYEIYNLIANIHRRKSNYDKALEYNSIAKTFSQSPKSIHSTLYTNILILSETNRLSEALKLSLICLKYYEEQGFMMNTGDIQFVIAYLYYNIGDYKKANYFIDKVLTYPPSKGEYQIDVYSQKAKICIELGDTKTAQLFTNKSLALVDSVSFNMKNIGYDTKIELEKALGNYNQVAFYTEKKYNLLAQKYELDNKNKLHQLEVELDVTEKENKIKSLKIEQLRKQMEISDKNNYLFYISILLVIAVLSILIYVKNFRTIKNKNLIIENEKLIVQKSLVEKETLLREIHHRVKNNLQLVMSLLYVQSKEKGMSMDDFIEISQSRIISMSLIHENLYNTGDLSKVDFKDYLHKLTHLIIGSNGNLVQNIQIQIEMEDLYFDIQTAIPLGLIINELISNAYKHAFVNRSEGIITVAMKQKEDDFEIVVKDNGVGMTEKEISKKTLGQELVKQLVNQINGVLEIQNNAGMRYIIHFKNISY
ncbi:MAG: ATP-binding protein [Arcicella sp.]|jgi:two-component sensor histidine kinase|nr:ATP-binding protein [Arcicella sp.]